MTQARACVSIDLDGLDCYGRIHALHLPDASRPDPLHTLAVQRFGELMAETGLSGTAFVIGESLKEAAAREAIRGLFDAGHELGNHSLSHDYRLSLRPAARIAAEVEGGARALEDLTGERPEGFRAPGYNLSPALLEAVVQSGATYDSSIFPSAPYLAARAGVLGVMAVLGRASASHAGPASAVLAPQTPYRPHPRDLWRRGKLGLLELPITVLPGVGLPFIGTAVNTFPWPVVKQGLKVLRRRSFLNLELHGIDLVDESDGLPPELAARQRDLRVPTREKLRRLREVLSFLEADRPVVPLREVARQMA